MLSRSSSIKVFRFENADREEAAAFMAREMRGDSPAEEWLGRFSQWWDRNPHAPADWPRGCVLRCGDRIVGMHAWIPLTYAIGGEIHTACAGSSWCVEPEFRAYSFSMALRFKSAPADILVASSAIPAVRKVLKVLHFTRVRPMSEAIFGRTLDHAALAKLMAARRGAPALFRRAAGLIAPLMTILPDLLARRSVAPAAPTALDCVVVDHLDPGFDQLWQELRNHHPSLLVRDASSMSWYAFDPAVRGRRMLIACRDRAGRWLGYALFNIYRESGVEGKRASLIDMIVHPHAPNAIHAIVNTAARAASERRLWQIDFHASDELQLRQLQQTRLRPRNGSRDLFIFVRRGLSNRVRPEQFFLTGLDGDGGLN
jgi:hypothetical protein